MLDDLHSDDLPEQPRPAPDRSRPASDREVPLDLPAAVLSDAVHAWLDGESSEDSARREQPADVEFWKRMSADLARYAAQRPQPGFAARVMAALPPSGDR